MRDALYWRKQVALEELSDIEEIKDGFFDSFIEREFISQHRIIFFHTSHFRGKWMYYCTHCNSFHVVDSNWKDGSVHTCDGCHRRFKVQRYSKIKPVMDYIVKFESNRRHELIVRYFYIMRDIKKTQYGYDEVHSVIEIGRMNKKYEIGIKQNTYKTLQGYICHSFWNNYDDWREDCTEFWRSYPTDHVYIPKLSKVMKQTGYEYSGFSEAIKLGFGLLDYLFIYDRYPSIERLAKSNARNYLRALLGALNYYTFDHYLSTLSKATAKQISQFIRHDLDPIEAEILLNADVSNPDTDLIRLMRGANYTGTYEPAKKIKRVLNYICTCNKHTEKKINYRDYRDYIEMAQVIGLSVEKYPKDFWMVHDEAAKKFRIDRNSGYDKLIKKRSADKEVKRLKYSSKKFLIKPVECLDELFNESKELHHCVRTYAKNVAFGDTNILFVRKADDIENPFVTLELKNNRVIQCRAKYNAKPTDEVIGFVNDWCSMNNFISCF
jgi:transposase-like protein